MQGSIESASVQRVQSLLPATLQDAPIFADRLVKVYGEAMSCLICERLSHPFALTYWCNPLRSSEFEPVGRELCLPGLYTVERDAGLTHHPAAERGEIYFQNPSSYFAVWVLQPQADEEVLDMAAAPGGKTIAMAAAMGNTGRIAAVEPVRGRFHRLQANLQRCGVTNTKLYQKDGRGLGRVVPERFDRVLLDAPCSSEARMRWSQPASFSHWTQRKVKEAQRKQKSLLRAAYAALKPGGILVYCTCSLGIEENEAVVAHLLKRTDARLCLIDTTGLDAIPLMTSPGVPDRSLPERLEDEGGAKQAPSGTAERRQHKGHSDELQRAISHGVRIVPDSPWDGFFVTKIRKPA